MDQLHKDLKEASSKMREATTLSEEIVHWIEWCKLFKKKEQIETANRANAKEYRL